MFDRLIALIVNLSAVNKSLFGEAAVEWVVFIFNSYASAVECNQSILQVIFIMPMSIEDQVAISVIYVVVRPSSMIWQRLLTWCCVSSFFRRLWSESKR